MFNNHDDRKNLPRNLGTRQCCLHSSDWLSLSKCTCNIIGDMVAACQSLISNMPTHWSLKVAVVPNNTKILEANAYSVKKVNMD